ncbi:hypothetical protein G9A89_001778 [Geosiphon pyriformis]|nr:hypothetical protein G9A89_001778 [Geosiphon pyriformis]
MIAFATILAGSAVANWYRVLDRYVTIKNPNYALVTRVAMDQIFFAPCFMGIFFIAQGIMEGQKLESIKKSWKRDIHPPWSTIINSSRQSNLLTSD